MKPWGRVGGVGLLALMLGAMACKKKPDDMAEPIREREQPSSAYEQVQMGVRGFNYTDLYIENFSVAGVGGGNVPVSSSDSGGGGITCCLGWSAGLTLPFAVRVEWTRDIKQVCEKEVMISTPIPPRPQYIAVHFFQDGRIEVELTEDIPSMKLHLERFSPRQRKPSGNTVLDEQIARCHDAFSP